MNYAKRREAEKKDKCMTVTAADKKGNTPAYRAYKAGNKCEEMLQVLMKK